MGGGMRSSSKSSRMEGFSLIELIVVITIIGILATVVVVNVAGRSDQAKVAKVKTDFETIKAAASMFREDYSRWPEDLQELINPPETADGVSLGGLDKEPIDPWSGEPYHFEPTDNGILLISFGADQAEGGDGFDKDIYSDEEQN